MAGYKILLSFLGNSSSLVGATSKAGAAISSLSSNFKNASNMANNLSARINSAGGSISQAATKAASFGSRLQGAFKSVNVSASSKQLDILKQKLSLADRTVAQFQKKMQDVNSPNVDTARVDVLKKKLTEATTRVTLLSQKLQEVQQPPVDTRRVSALTGALQQTEKSIDLIRTKLSAALSPAPDTRRVSELKGQLKLVENQATSLKQKLIQLNTPATANPQDVKLLEDRLAVLQKQKAAVQAAQKQAGAGATDAQKLGFEKALSTVDIQIDRTVKQLSKLKFPPLNTSAIKQVEDELARVTQRAKDLKARLKDAQNPQANPVVVTELQNRLDAAIGKSRRLQAELSRAMRPSANPEKVAELQQRLDKARGNAESLQKQLDAALNPSADPNEILKVEKQLLAATEQADKLRAAVAAAGDAGKGSGSKGPGVFSGLISGYKSFYNSLSSMDVRKRFQGIFQGASKAIDTFRAQVINLTDSIRLSAQGLTNFGRSMMFFISIPLAGAMGMAANQAISFEDAMIRVGKTSNMDGASLTKLSGNISKLANNTATSTVELAQLAEVLGQQGMGRVFDKATQQWVDLPNTMFSMIRTVDMFAVATAQSGEEAGLALGKIAAAFGKNLNTAGDDVYRLANVINYLENTTAASAQDIQNALLEFASFSATIGIRMQDAAGFAATLVSLGLSAQEAGTSLKNMTVNVPRHAQELADAMQGVNDKYTSADAVIKAMNEDAVGFFKDLITAAAGGNDKVSTLLTLMEVADIRGGRGIAAMANNLTVFNDNMDAANREWVEALSLAAEYEKAMSSTKSQLAMLKNNLTDAANTAGAAFLPAINQLIQIAVPAIRMLSDAFKSLSKNQQLMVIGGVLVIAVLGPMLMFFGQLVHSVSLLVMGFGQAVRVVAFFIGSLSNLVPAILSIGRFLLGWPGMVLLAGAGILKVLQALGVDIAGFFSGIAKKALDWGQNLAANLADGLLGGAVRYITQAINFIANLISSFFESHSPPDAGPLKTIDMWGIGLMKTFLKGFKNADFSILSDISSIVERELTRGVTDEGMPGALKALANARLSITELVSKFNATGVIDEGILDNITRGLGEVSDETKEIIRLSIKYNGLQERLAEIEARRKGVVKSYNDEVSAIARSNRSLTDKIAAIRALQRNRDDGLRGLDKEEEALKEQSDQVKEQLDYQKNLVGAIQDQEDLFARIADAIENLANKLKNAGGGGADTNLGGLGGGGLPEDPGKGLQDLADQAIEIKDRFENGKLMLQGLFDAWNGVKAPDDIFPDDATKSGYDTMYKIGELAGNVRDKFFELRDGAVSTWETITGKVSEFRKNFESMKGGLSIDWKEVPVIGEFIKGFETGFDPTAIEMVKKALDEVKKAWDELMVVVGRPEFKEASLTLLGVIGAIAGGLAWVIGFVVGRVAAVLTFVVGFITWYKARIAQNYIFLLNIVLSIIEWFNGMKDAVGRVWEDVKTAAAGVWENIKTTVTTKINELLAAFGITEEIKTKWQKIWDDVVLIASAVWENIKTSVSNGLSVAEGAVSDGLANVRGVVEAGNTLMKTAADKVWQAVIDAAVAVLAGPETWFGGALKPTWDWLEKQRDTAYAIAGNIIQGLIDGWVKRNQEFVDIVTGGVQNALDAVKKLLGINSPSTVFSDIGVNIIQGLIDGLNSLLKTLLSTVGDIAGSVLEGFTSIFSGKDSEDNTADMAFITNFSTVTVPSMKTTWAEFTNFLLESWATMWVSAKVTLDTYVPMFTGMINGLFSLLTVAMTSAKTSIDQAKTSIDTLIATIGTIVTDPITAIGTAFGEVESAVLGAQGAIDGFVAGLDKLDGKVITITLQAVEAGQKEVAHASGGLVVAGNPYHINEIGGEGFIPNTNGRIVPAHVMRGIETVASAGGGNVSVEVNIHNPQVRDDRDIDKIIKQTKDEIVKAISQRNRLGGTI